MTIADIKELLSLGFTNEQIVNLSQTDKTAPTVENPTNTAPVESPTDAPADAPAPAPAPAPADTSEQTDKGPDDEKRFSELQSQIDNLTKQIQAQNRANASVDVRPDDDLMKKTDDAMAELIRPTMKKGG